MATLQNVSATLTESDTTATEPKPTVAHKVTESLGSAWNATKQAANGVKDGINQRLTMEGLLSQAHYSLQHYLNPKLIQAVERMSKELLRKALGIAFITEAKGGFIFGVKGGCGVIILRKKTNKKAQNEPGQWSPPCAIKTGGLSVGFQAGAVKMDHMYVPNELFCSESIIESTESYLRSTSPLNIHFARSATQNRADHTRAGGRVSIERTAPNQG